MEVVNDVLEIEQNYVLIKESKGKWLDKRVCYMIARAFCNTDHLFDEETYNRLNEEMKQAAGFFSVLSQPIRGSIIGLMMANDKTQTSDIQTVIDNYKILKEHGFRSSPFTYFGAYLLLFSETGERAEIGQRALQIFDEIKAHHRLLTGPEDGAVAISLAQQSSLLSYSATEVGTMVEENYQALREHGFRRQDELQFAAAAMTQLAPSQTELALTKIDEVIEELQAVGVRFRPEFYHGIVLLAFAKTQGATNITKELPAYLTAVENGTHLRFQKSYRQTLAISLYLGDLLTNLSAADVNALALNINLMIIQEQMIIAASAATAAAASSASS